MLWDFYKVLHLREAWVTNHSAARIALPEVSHYEIWEQKQLSSGGLDGLYLHMFSSPLACHRRQKMLQCDGSGRKKRRGKHSKGELKISVAFCIAVWKDCYQIAVQGLFLTLSWRDIYLSDYCKGNENVWLDFFFFFSTLSTKRVPTENEHLQL